MGEFIEKITLYDLLGYTLPGSVVVSVLLLGKRQEIAGALVNYKDYSLYIFLAFLAVSFLLGIQISEVAGWITNILGWVARGIARILGWFAEGTVKLLERFVVWLKRKLQGKSFPGKECLRKIFYCMKNKCIKINADISYSVNTEDVCNALKNAGLKVENREEDQKNILIEQYFNFMYDDLQKDKTYSRIHNYASAVTLYKNMMLVSFLSEIILIFQGMDSLFTVLCCILSMEIFLIRWDSFSQKKKEHTVRWFVGKYVARRDFQESV